MPSFDFISEINMQEVDNAINQAQKEIAGRYDFRGSKSSIDWDKKEITINADDEYKLNAMKDILQSKIHKRGIDIKALKFEKATPVGGMMLKQTVKLLQGIDKESSSKIMKAIRDSKIKVQAQLNDEKIRVTSKSIDSLQECIAFVRGQDFGIPLQTNNMRS
ncbi:MAG: YajQ family cyclic di-GMP-binding protein [Proteobacteria bacterium SG_bin7]|nr:MAG: YajQ family cyclic di-GMP-binding protein [Proteobacteria bacterium SG_bin7]